MVAQAQELPKPAGCLHCGSPIPADSALEKFCCTGCEAVYGLIVDQGLTRYYQLAGSSTTPAVEARTDRSLTWLEPLVAAAEARQGPVCALELDVQGIHCAACVWLMNELFRREEGGAQIVVNPALGKMRLAWRRGAFDVARYLRKVESFGYLFGPSRKKAGAASMDLPIRLGISAAITMNVMIYSISFYLGLTPAEGVVFDLFTKLNVWLSAIVVVVGGWPFFRSAWQGLRRGVLHLDLPIALGIILVFVTSLIKSSGGRGDLAYFDTLNTFVTLMLVGRWLQERVLERNRRFLLEDDGADAINVRRVAGGAIENIPAPRVRTGDELLVAPGELVPVDGALLDDAARVSTEWITGEADRRDITRDAQVPAGAFNAGASAFRVRAATDFADSPLGSLLRQTAPESAGPAASRFWDRLARNWVIGVLTVSALGLLLWLPAGSDRALDVAAALLVVTCPCAIGIATPLAYEVVQSRMRKLGFYVRSQALLERLPRVRKILFDKTGTLTLGRLELQDRSALDGLPIEARDIAYDLTARSNHPVSRALAGALAKADARFSPEARVRELPGKGLELERDAVQWRLGAPAWALTHPIAEHQGATVLARNGEAIASFRLRESIRPDARREVALLAQTGHEVWIVSGDSQARVDAMAEGLGVRPERALGGRRPEQKAEDVARIDRGDTLFLGDGVNDSLAFERALCAGTPAIDRPVMPGKAHFFLLGEGLASIRSSLALARRLRTVVTRILVLAAVYNVLTITASLSGLMTPVRAAIAMPVSSLTVILLAVFSLRERPRRVVTPVAASSPSEVPA